MNRVSRVLMRPQGQSLISLPLGWPRRWVCERRPKRGNGGAGRSWKSLARLFQ
ncbi:hypothetical protein BJX64DRAFT_247181 [Aspergillus heterothallicus]